MTEIVPMPDAMKKGNTGERANRLAGSTRPALRVLKGGLYGHVGVGTVSRPLSPEEWLEREMRSLFASWKSNDGTGAYASRGIANAAQSINFPCRIPARRIREAHQAKVNHALVRRLGVLLMEYADRLYTAHPVTMQRPDPDPVSGALGVRRAA